MHIDWKDGLQHYINLLKETHNLTQEEILTELQNTKIPANIYAGELTALQATTKYLHQQGKSPESIAKQLKRTTRDVNNFLEKATKPLPKTTSKYTIPANCFADKNLSPGEHVIKELQKQHLNIQEIAKLLNKNEQTIYTQHYRIQQKQGESQ